MQVLRQNQKIICGVLREYALFCGNAAYYAQKGKTGLYFTPGKSAQ
jgi:hypothetical protein